MVLKHPTKFRVHVMLTLDPDTGKERSIRDSYDMFAKDADECRTRAWQAAQAQYPGCRAIVGKVKRLTMRDLSA